MPIQNNKKSVLTILVAFLCAPAIASSTISAERQAELMHLLRHDCGSCHGMTLQGGLGPALTAKALSGKSQDFLKQTVLDGRSGTAMPPWRGLLSEREVAWLVQQLMEGADLGR
ncbi:MAG: hypothetical protein AMJ68_04960 [Acidithiobacillales bacterium SG8_45]|nr:MAG: hypothetical protein AMJ68_04960 [Acidithiobacillales bacterium SG8_45]